VALADVAAVLRDLAPPRLVTAAGPNGSRARAAHGPQRPTVADSSSTSNTSMPFGPLLWPL
jgi:hypothetical protein